MLDDQLPGYNMQYTNVIYIYIDMKKGCTLKID